MPTIELTEQEAAMLAEVLESCLSEVRTERLRTDNKQLHARFVEHEALLDRLIPRLQRLKMT